MEYFALLKTLKWKTDYNDQQKVQLLQKKKKKNTNCSLWTLRDSKLFNMHRLACSNKFNKAVTISLLENVTGIAKKDDWRLWSEKKLLFVFRMI